MVSDVSAIPPKDDLIISEHAGNWHVLRSDGVRSSEWIRTLGTRPGALDLARKLAEGKHGIWEAKGEHVFVQIE